MKLFVRVVVIAVVIVMVALVLVFASQRKTVTTDIEPTASAGSPSPSAEPSPSPSPSPSPEPMFYNPLTGLPVSEDAADNRPYAIMLNNIKAAQPLLGISEADILIEIPVEGGITRLMALYQDISAVGKIGSIRSARTYYVEIAQGYDAVYIHAGGSPQAYSYMKSSGITHLDGVNGSKQDIYFRDAQRKKDLGYEHSLVSSGELITKFLPTYGIELNHPKGYEAGMTFADQGAPTGGLDALGATVHFSSSKTTAFAYDAQTALYGVTQFNKPLKDGNSGEQLSVTNVLILKTDIYNIAGDTAGRLNVDVTGGGKGTFLCGGKYIPVKWEKSSSNSPFLFTLEDGTPLVFGRGTTYICVVSDGDAVEIK